MQAGNDNSIVARYSRRRIAAMLVAQSEYIGHALNVMGCLAIDAHASFSILQAMTMQFLAQQKKNCPDTHSAHVATYGSLLMDLMMFLP